MVDTWFNNLGSSIKQSIQNAAGDYVTIELDAENPYQGLSPG